MAAGNPRVRPQRLFFYGTLTHEHDNPATRAVMPLLRCLGRASTPGALYVIQDPCGWYPVLASGHGRVRGWLYETRPEFGRAALRMLDEWEWFFPPRPFASEFVRRRVTVTNGRLRFSAQTYCFNRAVHSGLRAVPGGDFGVFIARRRAAAFGA